MPHQMDARGIVPQKPGTYTLVPDNTRCILRVNNYEEKFSTAGDYMVVVEWAVETPEQYAGVTIPYHNVTFKAAGAKGAGIAIHFLKTIGEPFEGETLDIDPGRWLGKKVSGLVGQETYTPEKGKNAGRLMTKNVVRTIDPVSQPSGDERLPF